MLSCYKITEILKTGRSNRWPLVTLTEIEEETLFHRTRDPFTGLFYSYFSKGGLIFQGVLKI